MQIDQWSILVGVLMSTALAIGPWMFKVHAKLAVIASRVVDLCEKLETSTTEQRRLWEICMRHENQLAHHDRELQRISEPRGVG